MPPTADDKRLTVADLDMIGRHVCEPKQGLIMQEMRAGFDRIETKIDTLAADDARKFSEVSHRQDSADARQDKTDEEMAALKKAAGIALAIYGFIALAAGAFVASAGAWLKAKIVWMFS